jgi:uncharacterized membrane protein YedE/YeeE
MDAGMDFKKYLNIKSVSAVLAGAVFGFGYYYFIGCRTGSCPISGSPYISTLYGAVVGLVLTLPSKKKNGNNNDIIN